MIDNFCKLINILFLIDINLDIVTKLTKRKFKNNDIYLYYLKFLQRTNI